MFLVCHIASVACTGSAILASWSYNAGGYYLMGCHLPTDRSRHTLQRFSKTRWCRPPEGRPVIACRTGWWEICIKERIAWITTLVLNDCEYLKKKTVWGLKIFICIGMGNRLWVRWGFVNMINMDYSFCLQIKGFEPISTPPFISLLVHTGVKSGRARTDVL